ncbi:MAG TPA: peptide chain release factor N(5)-glutamine methyltransferase [Gammaproteobacteria bacterium]|nr:peptide chain release factor N(5)-glutamine methyltransferase [Gammaproteobacteria bacterium]
MAAASRIEISSVQALLAWAAPALAAAGATARLDAELLLAFATGWRRSTVVAFPERIVDEQTAARFQHAIARRARGEPLAYVTGRKEFFSIALDVTPAVLIPRPETELLVEEILARFPRSNAHAVLDLGTGSGALALAIKQHRPAADVWAVDVSGSALTIARGNALRLGLDVHWVQSDWFAALDGRRFDAILCNPPYVRSDDAALSGALSFEPRLALDGGSDGLQALRVLLDQAPAHLTADGLLLLEHGYDQRSAVLELGAAAGFDAIATRGDLAGHERMVVLRSLR